MKSTAKDPIGCGQAKPSVGPSSLAGSATNINEFEIVLSATSTRMKTAFADVERGVFAPSVEGRSETVERNGGCHERRIMTVQDGPDLCEWVADPTEWPGVLRGRRQHSAHHYISSRLVDAATLQELVRGHWGVENASTTPWISGSGRTTDASARAMPPP